MITVSQIGMTAVKSTQLIHPSEVQVGEDGLIGDRRFLIIHDDGHQLHAREKYQFLGLRFSHDRNADTLTVHLPDETKVTGSARAEGASLLIDHFGLRTISGHEINSAWNGLLSAHVGYPVRLVRIDPGGTGVDVFPVTLLTTASLERLEREVGSEVDPARFRASFLLQNSIDDEEDTWVGKRLRVGKSILQVRSAVPRCVVTSFNPHTGSRDLNVLRALARYRPTTGLPDGLLPDYRAVAFAVFAEVERRGPVALGDRVDVLNG